MSNEKKQPIRLTAQRAEALVAVIDAGIDVTENVLRRELAFLSLRSTAEVAELKRRDVQLAAAKDAAAIIRHRYVHGEEPTEEHATLF